MDDNEIKQILWKLAYFEPSSTDAYGNQILDYLILDALSSYGPLLNVNPLEIRSYIKDFFKIEFEEEEIISASKRLQLKGYVSVLEPDRRCENPQIKIQNEINEKITSNIHAIQEIEICVFEEWKDELSEKYKTNSLVKENIDKIISCLQKFLSSILSRHGIECVNLLYPDKPKAKEWLENVKGSIIEDLPKVNDYIDAVIKIEIPNFFLKQDEKRIRYLSQLFNSSFLWHLVQVDEKCSNLFRNVTKGQKLFLDNNVLYNLAGINGATVLKSAHKTLELAEILGYELWITTKTIDEYHDSLHWNMKEYKKKIPVPADLAKIALESLGENSFLTSYWSEFVDNNISIEEFVAEKSHIDDLLKHLDIQISKDYREEIEKSQELLHEESILESILDFQLNPNIIEHDAFHRVFINRIRGGAKYHFRESIAWFLTNDSKLPVYDKVARKGRSSLPFCLTVNQWIQVNRPLLVRTENRKEFEESFHILVTQPFIRAMTSSIDLDKAYHDVLGKLSKYKQMNPQIAFQIVTDTHFMHSVSIEDNYDVPQEKLENKFIDIAEELRNVKDENEQKYNSKLNAANQIISSLEKRNDYLLKMIKWIIFLLLITPISIFIWNDKILNHVPFIYQNKNFFLIKLFLQLIVSSLLLTIPLKKYKNYLLGTVVFTLLVELVIIIFN